MYIAAIAGDSMHPGCSLTSHYPHCVGTRQLGALPLADVIQNLGLSVPKQRGQQATRQWCGIPRLNYSPSDVPPIGGGGDLREKGDTKPSRYLVAKGLPTQQNLCFESKLEPI